MAEVPRHASIADIRYLQRFDFLLEGLSLLVLFKSLKGGCRGAFRE